jgi:hypothetical protein
MGALYAPQTDFRMDVWMGWEPGDRPHGLYFQVETASGTGLALFGFRDNSGFGPLPIILAGAGGRAVSVPAPPPGNYQFTITRTGRQFEFYLDGSFFAEFPVNFDLAAGGVSLTFEGPFPGQFGPLHVDRVQVIPAPGTFVLPVAVALGCIRRRRR